MKLEDKIKLVEILFFAAFVGPCYCAPFYHNTFVRPRLEQEKRKQKADYEKRLEDERFIIREEDIENLDEAITKALDDIDTDNEDLEDAAVRQKVRYPNIQRKRYDYDLREYKYDLRVHRQIVIKRQDREIFFPIIEDVEIVREYRNPKDIDEVLRVVRQRRNFVYDAENQEMLDFDEFTERYQVKPEEMLVMRKDEVVPEVIPNPIRYRKTGRYIPMKG